MARDSSFCSRDDLLELEDRLLDQGFGFLMSILPVELFQMYNERIIIINESMRKLSNDDEAMVIAYVTKPDEQPQALNVDVVADAFTTHDFPASLKRKKGDPQVELVHIGDPQIEQFRRYPPLSWHEKLDPDYERSPECRDHTIALIQYYLLVWASKNSVDAQLPQPDHHHLVAALERLRTTHHYKKKEVIDETEERVDVQMCLRKDEHPRSPAALPSDDEKLLAKKDSQKEDVEADHNGLRSRELSSPSTEHQQELVNAARLPTPHQTPKQPTMDVDMPDSTEVSTRAASVASAGDAAPGAELSALETPEAEVALTLETEALVRQSLPTPDTLMEEVVTETDPTLRDIQKKMGHETLALLPLLSTCTFKKIHTTCPGFLSLRLLLGTFREDTSRPELEGSEAWASFKMHDKNDRAAPRMHVHAFRIGTDEVVADDLKIKDVLPDLNLGPAFNSIQGGDRAEELLLKALVKYFFIIAARDKLLGFDKHKMPFNGSFVDQLKIACKRLQMTDLSRDDQRMHARPFKRLKRSHNPTPRASASLSDADDDGPTVRTRDARRSGRRTGQPSSTAVSESEDNIPVYIPVIPQRIPRRLALGVEIVPLMEAPAVNEFLDPEAEPADSDGDSGDEIPPPIADDNLRFFLSRRHNFQKQYKFDSESVKHFKNRKESTIMGIRKVKGMLNKNVMEPADRIEAERGLEHRRMCETTIRTHLALKEGSLERWKARVKQVNREAAGIDPKVIEAWDALYKS